MHDFLIPKVQNFRYERKFYIDEMNNVEVEAVLRYHPAMFREIYHQRIVNNIYLDSFDMSNYFDNMNGLSNRSKVRVRWYGNTLGCIEAPVLELKLKHNLHIGKLSHRLETFVLGRGFSISILRDVFRRSHLSDGLRSYLLSLNMSLLNSYTRKYFLSADGRFRVTLDSGIRFFELLSYQNEFLFATPRSEGVVVEIKYNNSDVDRIENITNFFPFRMTRNSKYAMGIGHIYG